MGLGYWRIKFSQARPCPNTDQYSGETKKTGQERFTGQRNSIINTRERAAMLPVGEHWCSAL